MTEPFVAGKKYRMRSGELAYIERRVGNRLLGHDVRFGLPLEWNLEGRRRPVGGTDPFDLTRTVRG